MTITSMFRVLPNDGKATQPGRNEIDFPINRDNGRLAILPGWLVGKKVRVRTGVPWIWEGRVELPDRSRGDLVMISCSVRLEGTLKDEPADLRQFVARLLRDKFEFDRLFGRALENAITKYGPDIGNRFIDNMRPPSPVEAGLLMELAEDRLFITQVSVRPFIQDQEETRYFTDDIGLPFKTAGTLEQNRMGYKAGLAWGREIEQIVARLAYRGAIMGQVASGPAKPELEPGQIEPLEAWFRQLLQQRLELIDLVTLNDFSKYESIVAAIKGDVSKALGKGTGRVVETLVLHLLPDGNSRDERPLQFTESYELPGTGGSMLQVLHTVKFALVDRDRAAAAGEEDAQTMLKREIAESTRLYLLDKQFERIVSLYFEHSQHGGAERVQSDLEKEVSRLVAPMAMRHGLKIVSTSAVLKIPQQDFVDGREVDVGMMTCPIAEQWLTPCFRVVVELKLADAKRQQTFASALGRADPLEKMVIDAVQQTVRTTLRGMTALQYYGSGYVNSLPILSVGGERADLGGDLASTLGAALDEMLPQRFGLQLARVDLTPDRDDPIIRRMQEFNNYAVQYPSEGAMQHIGLHDADNTILQIGASAKIIISSLHPGWWSRFQSNTSRYVDFQDHVDAIRQVLTECLQSMHNELVERMVGSAEIILADYGKRAALQFTRQIVEQHGLWAYLSPINLTAAKTDPKRAATEIMVRNLREDLSSLLERRRRTENDQDRADISKEIKAIREELDKETALLESQHKALRVARLYQLGETGEVISEDTTPELVSPAALARAAVQSRRIAVGSEERPQSASNIEHEP